MTVSGDLYKPENLKNHKEKTCPTMISKKHMYSIKNGVCRNVDFYVNAFLGKRFEEPDAVLIQRDNYGD